MDTSTSFYDAGKKLILSQGIESDPRIGHYVAKHGAVFAENDFRKALMNESIELPKNTKAITAAKKDFERGWKDGQVERFQIEAITQEAIVRRMHDKTMALISKERQRIAKNLFN